MGALGSLIFLTFFSFSPASCERTREGRGEREGRSQSTLLEPWSCHDDLVPSHPSTSSPNHPIQGEQRQLTALPFPFF